MRFSALAATVAMAVPTAAFSLACAVPNLPPDESTQDEQASTDPASSKTPATRGTTTPPSTGSGSGSGSGSSTPPGATPSSTPDASAPPPTPPTPPTNTCGSASTADACFRCCDVAHPNAMPLLDNEWGKCQCEVPGVCASACASSYCAGQAVVQGGSCDNCLAANNQTCRAKADTKCAADATCKPYLTCTTDAKCASKPL